MVSPQIPLASDPTEEDDIELQLSDIGTPDDKSTETTHLDHLQSCRSNSHVHLPYRLSAPLRLWNLRPSAPLRLWNLIFAREFLTHMHHAQQEEAALFGNPSNILNMVFNFIWVVQRFTTKTHTLQIDIKKKPFWHLIFRFVCTSTSS
ncbi:hypothetical protein PoB_002432400 [Plakobranchus ocellatus]|uniref:Uncharacterized protein n=1 Tax=Plakobranchus ocellatus TaxID=259542 RepID=A0AAV3ZTT5_9GAST|nr:hypothetical protein PoB_002432400 [Plakobranchus ocellatus]